MAARTWRRVRRGGGYGNWRRLPTAARLAAERRGGPAGETHPRWPAVDCGEPRAGRRSPHAQRRGSGVPPSGAVAEGVGERGREGEAEGAVDATRRGGARRLLARGWRHAAIQAHVGAAGETTRGRATRTGPASRARDYARPAAPRAGTALSQRGARRGDEATDEPSGERGGESGGIARGAGGKGQLAGEGCAGARMRVPRRRRSEGRRGVAARRRRVRDLFGVAARW